MVRVVFHVLLFRSVILFLSSSSSSSSRFLCEAMMMMMTQFVSRPVRNAASRSMAFWGIGNHHCPRIPSAAGRLFGTKRGVARGNSPLGTVAIYNDQTALPKIDEEALQATIRKISYILGYETYDVTLLLVDDEEMRETNLESRGVDAPTDILSFPFLQAMEPGLLELPEFDVPDYYTLGDMMVDVPYVIRRCKEDMEDVADNEEYEEDDDRGVSGAMAKVSDPEKRIHMLLVHGMLHLVGHDHEDDDEYEQMVQREEEILKELEMIE